MRPDREPASVGRFLLNLVAGLGITLFAWNVAAPDSWKDAAHRFGNSFERAGVAADNLQRTGWLWNLGFRDKPDPRQEIADWFKAHPEAPRPKVGDVWECNGDHRCAQVQP